MGVPCGSLGSGAPGSLQPSSSVPIVLLCIISAFDKEDCFWEIHVCGADPAWLEWPIIQSFAVVDVPVICLKRKGYLHSSNLIE